MVTLQYGSFAALGEWVKIVTLTASHSKRVVDQALRGQREHLEWTTICCQELGLFLLERFHNATLMPRKE